MMNPGMVLYDMTLIDHIVAMLVCVVAPVLALTSRQMAMEDIRLEPEEKIRLYHSNALLLFVFTLVVITVWRLPGRSVIALGFDWPVLSPVVLLLTLAVVLFYALDYFFQYGIPKWRAKTMQQRHASLTFVPTNTKELLHFVFLALAAGIGEEIIFRGYLIHYIVYWTGNAWTGILVACFFSSALFAFLHGYQGYKSVIKIFFLAMLFAAIFVLSQSLVLVMIIHTLIDVLSGWLGIYILKNFQQQDEAENETEV